MPANPQITERLASRLKEERQSKGLSLDALAKLSGVSRSMLSQIERGESSPTVASLWNLTRALNVDFSKLLDENEDGRGPIRAVLRADQVPVIHNARAKCLIRILSAPEDVGGTEIYDIDFESGASLDSDAHKIGSVESLTVLSGALRVTSDGKQVDLGQGDTARYAADCPHRIETDGPARGLLVVKHG